MSGSDTPMHPEDKHRITRQPQTHPEKVVRLRVSDVLGGAKEARLTHNGEDYRLRITYRGKLLLTK